MKPRPKPGDRLIIFDRYLVEICYTTRYTVDISPSRNIEPLSMRHITPIAPGYWRWELPPKPPQNRKPGA